MPMTKQTKTITNGLCPENIFLICECDCLSHIGRLSSYVEKNGSAAEAYIEVMLNPYLGFWQRLWLGIIYIISPSRTINMHSPFDTLVMGTEDIGQLSNYFFCLHEDQIARKKANGGIDACRPTKSERGCAE